MTRRALDRSMVSLLVALVGFGAGALANPPRVVWSVDAPGAGLPSEMPAGYTLFTAENDTENGYSLTLFRLRDGATVEALQQALSAIDLAFGGEGDPVAAINSALELAEIHGEFEATAEAPGRMGVVLEAGNYLLDGSFFTEEAAPERSYHAFTVSGSGAGDIPAVSQTIEMVDFAFTLPPGIGGGEQTWLVTNSGQQLHHMVVFRLNEGKTMDDFWAFMETEEGEPPGVPAAYVGILSPGRSMYVTLDLQPGTYVASCFMPDHHGAATGTPHAMLGMAQSFVIAGQ